MAAGNLAISRIVGKFWFASGVVLEMLNEILVYC